MFFYPPPAKRWGGIGGLSPPSFFKKNADAKHRLLYIAIAM